jgi:hypothetical protein
MKELTRRTLFLASSAAGLGSSARARGLAAPAGESWFPQQPRELVQEVVGAAHRDLERVRELVLARPSLAKASWDWGFGDWESALGAAAHTGQREIALFLIEHGARPDVFAFAMLGHLAAVRACIEAQPGLERARGPHGISLLRHALSGGDEAKLVAEFLAERVGEEPEPLLLDETQVAALVGEYRGEPEEAFTLTVGTNKGLLTIQRDQQPRITLEHLGELAFSPRGAEAVRIGFELSEGPAKAVRIVDGERELRFVR